MFAVLDPTGLLVAYENWDSWRDERRAVSTQPPPPLVPQGVSFCAQCWGQGRIHRPARNGEGLIPTACGTCGGTGLVG
jgi:hypothetical protein